MARSPSLKLAKPRPSRSPRAADVTATDHAYAELKRRINCNQLPAGRMFMQDELASMLKISRTPAREALIRLAEEGLVEIRPRHGVLVRPFTLDELAGTYEVLTVLEAHAARRLAERGASAAGLKRLVQAHQTMETALGEQNLAAWVAADEAFHKVLVCESGNEPLRSIVNALWDRLRRVRHVTLQHRPLPAQSNHDHAALIDAIRRRDAAQAFEVHLQHRTRTVAAMLDLLSANGFHQI